MALKNCPICGEKYSDTYKDCPFCEEEEALEYGTPIRRNTRKRGGSRVKQQEGNLLTPVLIVLILIMAGILVYLLFGDAIAEKLGFADPEGAMVEETLPGQDETDPGQTGTEDPEGTQGGETTEDPDTTGSSEMDYETAAALPAGLSLSTTDFSLMNPGENHTIQVSGGSGEYQWFSQDPSIGTVDQNGKVTAVSGGTVNIVVTDGEKQGTCIVRMRFESTSTPPATSAPANSGSGGPHTLNREDMTLPVGDSFRLQMTGVTTEPVWSSSDPDVAKVSGNGTVTALSPGNATVTVSWDGGSLQCIVRVTG